MSNVKNSENDNSVNTDKENGSSSGSSNFVKTSKLVSLRNRFFYMMYRNSILVFFASLIVAIFSVILLVFFAVKPVPPQYIPLSPSGGYVSLDPVEKCKADKDVQYFALNAIKKLYRYDYINYKDQLQEVADFFTADGWNSYLVEFKNAGMVDGLEKNKWIISVNPFDLPIITNKDIDAQGRCTVDLKTNLSLQYTGVNSLNPKGEFHVRVVRQSVIDNPTGLGISRVVFSPK